MGSDDEVRDPVGLGSEVNGLFNVVAKWV